MPMVKFFLMRINEMKKETNLNAGISEPEKVTEFLNKLEHPLLDLMQYARNFILNINPVIGEGIYWNGPTFYFTGTLKPFDPKEYKRYLVGFNFYKQDTLRLIFLKGETATDPEGILEGDYKDGRRIASFKSIADLKNKETALKEILLELIQNME